MARNTICKNTNLKYQVNKIKKDMGHSRLRKISFFGGLIL